MIARTLQSRFDRNALFQAVAGWFVLASCLILLPGIALGEYRSPFQKRTINLEEHLPDQSEIEMPESWAQIEGHFPEPVEVFRKRAAQTELSQVPNDFTPVAAENVLVLHVFVDDQESTWDPLFWWPWEITPDGMMALATAGCGYIWALSPSSADLYFSNLDLTSYYYNAYVDMVIPDEPPESGFWPDQVCEAMGYYDADGDSSFVDDMLRNELAYHPGYESALALFHVNKSGRSWAAKSFSTAAIFPRESGVFPTTPLVFAHEILHLFGACDEYIEIWDLPEVHCPGVPQCGDDVPQPWLDWHYPNDNCEACAPLTFPCIMQTASHVDFLLCQYTIGHIGWGDGDGDGALDLEEAAPYSWFSGPSSQTVNTMSVTMSGEAWSPYSHIESVSYQVTGIGDPVDPGAWIEIASSNDGAWDERHETFTVDVSLPTEGKNKIWVTTQNNAGNPQNSDLKFKFVTRDTQGPAAPFVRADPNSDQDQWFNYSNILVWWQEPYDATGVAGYSYVVDTSSDTDPPQVILSSETFCQYITTVSGDSWAHVAAVDDLGQWGETTHYRLRVDLTDPQITSLTSSTHQPGDWSNLTLGSFQWEAEDTPSGIFKYRYTVNDDPDWDASQASPSEYYTTTAPEATGVVLDNGEAFFHVAARDSAKGKHGDPSNWSVTSHFRLLIGTDPPGAPVPNLTSPPAGADWYKTNLVTFEWNEPVCHAGIAGYSYSFVDASICVLPDEEVDTAQRTITLNTGDSGPYTFCVRAVDEAGNWGQADNSVTIGIDNTAPNSVDDLETTSHPNAVGQADSVESANPFVTIEFDAADDWDSGVAAHTVVWDTIPATIPDNYNVMQLGPETSFTSPELTSGEWWVHVGAVDEAGNWTLWDEVAHLGPIVIDVTPPDPVTEVTALSGSGEVFLSWAASAAEDFAHYVLYRSDDEDLLGPQIASSVTDPFYTDSGLTNGEYYFYRVAAVDSAGLASDPSAQMVGYPQYVSPGNGTTYSNLCQLADASNGGVRPDGSGGYTMHGSVTISASDQLNIGPGEVLRSTDRSGTRQLIIAGVLRAIGTYGSHAEISATWPQSGAWGGVRMDSPGENCFLQYVDVLYGTTNVFWHHGNPNIHDCEIRQASDTGLDILVGSSEQDCEISGNVIEYCGVCGLRIEVLDNSYSWLGRNVIRHNGNGIFCSSNFPGTPPERLGIYLNEISSNHHDGLHGSYLGYQTWIKYNTIQGNNRGVVIEHEGADGSAPLIEDNNICSNSEAGIFISGQARPWIEHNTISGNLVCGIHSTDDSRPRVNWNTIHNSQIGVLVENSGWLPTLYLGENCLDQHSIAHVSNQTTVVLNAAGNFWGTANSDPSQVVIGPVLWNPTYDPTNLPPSITIIEPGEDGVITSTSAVIIWESSDPDGDLDHFTNSIYFDEDAQGLDGTTIAGGIDLYYDPYTFVWDVGDIPAGEYYIYGIFSDQFESASSYSLGTVTVIHPELTVSTDALSVLLEPEDSTSLPLTLTSVGETAVTAQLTEDDLAGLPLEWLSLSDTLLTLDPGDSAVVDVTFDAAGLTENVYRGQINIHSDDPSDSLLTVAVTLAVGQSTIAVSPDSVLFAAANVGDSQQALVALYNTGADTVTVGTLSGLEPPFDAELLDPATVAPGETARIRLTAWPTALGTFTDQLLIPTSDPLAPEVTVYVNLSVGGPAIALPDDSYEFGGIALGDTASWSFRIASTGDDTLQVTGLYASSMAFVLPQVGSFAVAAGDTSEVPVHFVPRAPGQADGIITLVHDHVGGPDTITLTGWGQAGSAAFGDTLLAFGAVSLGDTATVDTWLHNLGDLSFEVTDATLAGPFDLVTGGLPWTVPPADSLAVTVQYAPTSGSTQEGFLTLTTTEAEGSTPSVLLEGTGLLPGFSWDAGDLDFGLVEVGTESVGSLVLRNPGEGFVTVAGGFHDGTHFQLQSFPFPAAIPAGDSLVVQVAFLPDLVQTFHDTLEFCTPWSFLDTCVVAVQGSGATVALTLPETSYDFGQVCLGDKSSKWLSIVNEGGIAAEVTLLGPGSPFALEDTNTVVVPGLGSTEVTISFEPEILGVRNGSILVLSSDQPEFFGIVNLSGEGVEVNLVPPPTEIVADVFEQDSTRTIYTLENAGSGVMAFALLEEGELAAKRSAGKRAGGKLEPGKWRGDPRWMSRQPANAPPGAQRARLSQMPPPSGACEDDSVGALVLTRKEASEEIDIPWAAITQPYEYVCPDSTADAWIDLNSGGLPPAVYQGRLLLLTSDENADSTTVDLDMRVPRMRYATHDAGDIRLTVTDEGALGFFDVDQVESYGVGLQWPTGSPSHLIHGSLWVATGPDSLSDASYDYDFAVVPGQELTVIDDDPQTSHCRYNDALAANPIGIQVEQTTLAFGSEPDDDYVLLDYILSAAVELDSVYVGLYLDADIGDPFENSGGYLPDARLGRMFATDGSDSTLVGVVAMPGTVPVTFRMVHNPTYVWPQADFIDAEAWDLLSSGTFDQDTPSAADYSMLMVAGPLRIRPGFPTRLGFALAAGGSEAALAATAEAAKAKYLDVVTPVPQEPALPSRFALGNPYPNPFNPQVSLPVDVPAGGGRVRLDVYDIRGRRVKTLWDGHLDQGRTMLTWQGRDNNARAAASGVYFVRFLAPQATETKKIVLMR